MWVAVAPVSFNDVGHARRRPKRLAEKLRQIREALGLSQREMMDRLKVDVPYKNISKYERNQTEPPVEVLLAYAHAANVQMEQIVDDELDLTL
jgi:transcriptional regulator with XRE-family HTH domain